MKFRFFKSLLVLIFPLLNLSSTQAADNSEALLRRGATWTIKNLPISCGLYGPDSKNPLGSLLTYHYEMPPGKKPANGGIMNIVSLPCDTGEAANTYSVYLKVIPEGDFEHLTFERPVLSRLPAPANPEISGYFADLSLANAVFDSNTSTLTAREPLNEGGPGEWSEGEWYFDGNKFVLKKYSVGLFASSIGGEPHFKEVQLFPK